MINNPHFFETQQLYGDGAHCHCHCPPCSSSNRVILPFASGKARLIRTNTDGVSVQAAVMGFSPGLRNATVALTGETIDLGGAINRNHARQCALSLPYDCTVERLSVTLGLRSAIWAVPPGGTVIPYVMLYTAPPGGTVFRPLSATRVDGAPFTRAMPKPSMTSGHLEDIGAPLVKGTRVMIVGGMEVAGGACRKARRCRMHFSGGIGLCIRE